MTSTGSRSATERRAQILAAAARLFRQRGYAQVGIDDIGVAVRFTGPAIYRYFPSKQAMLAQLGVDFLERVRSEQGAGASPVDAVLEAALRDPDGLYALVRFADVLAADPDSPVAALRGTFGAEWDLVLPPLVDAALDSRTRLRMRALAGVFTHVTLVARTSLMLRRQVGTAAARVLAEIPVVGAPEAFTPRVPQFRHVTRREELLAVATRLMGERGYASVSLADIGAEAGVSASAVMRHFAAKEQLLAAAVGRAGEQLAGGIATALGLATSADDAVGRIAAMYARYVVECRDAVVMLATEAYSLSEQAEQARRRRHRMYVDELSHVVGLASPQWGAEECRLRAGAAFALMNELVISRAAGRTATDIDDVRALGMALLRDRPAPE